jgi:hypothetical protein
MLRIGILKSRTAAIGRLRFPRKRERERSFVVDPTRLNLIAR